MPETQFETPAKDIMLVTCRRWPNLSVGDAALAGELTARVHRFRHQPWNAAPTTEFTSADLVVLRSNWDYRHDLTAFDHWLQQIESSGA